MKEEWISEIFSQVELASLIGNIYGANRLIKKQFRVSITRSINVLTTEGMSVYKTEDNGNRFLEYIEELILGDSIENDLLKVKEESFTEIRIL